MTTLARVVVAPPDGPLQVRDIELPSPAATQVDLDDAKLDFAKRFGATHAVNGKNGDAVGQIRALTNGADEGLGFRGLAINGQREGQRPRDLRPPVVASQELQI